MNKPEAFWSFSDVPGWQEAFISEAIHQKGNLNFKIAVQTDIKFKKLFTSWENFEKILAKKDSGKITREFSLLRKLRKLLN